MPDVGRELDSLWREIDERMKGKTEPSQERILKEIRRYKMERKE